MRRFVNGGRRLSRWISGCIKTYQNPPCIVPEITGTIQGQLRKSSPHSATNPFSRLPSPSSPFESKYPNSTPQMVEQLENDQSATVEKVEKDEDALANSNNDEPNPNSNPPPPLLSKSAQKKLAKQQKYEAKKAQKKAALKEHKQREAERKRREWDEKLSSLPEEEKLKLLDSRREMRKERMEKRSEERGKKIDKLMKAKEVGQKIVLDLEFADLMTSNELSSLVQQIMYSYSVNGRCTSPAHLWLTGCKGDIQTHLQKIPGFDNWLIEKENRSYIEALEHQKENLVYLTADAETVLDDLDPKKIYIIGGLVDRNRWKGITMEKAKDQGISTAKLPIGNFLKMSSSQVLTVNQVVEILLQFLETRDWKTSFFHVIPQRKRCEADDEEREEDAGHIEIKKKCIEQPSSDNGNSLT